MIDIDEDKLADALISILTGFFVTSIVGCLFDFTIIEVSCFIFVILMYVVAISYKKKRLSLYDIPDIFIVIGLILEIFYTGVPNRIGSCMATSVMVTYLVDMYYDRNAYKESMKSGIRNGETNNQT